MTGFRNLPKYIHFLKIAVLVKERQEIERDSPHPERRMLHVGAEP